MCGGCWSRVDFSSDLDPSGCFLPFSLLWTMLALERNWSVLHDRWPLHGLLVQCAVLYVYTVCVYLYVCLSKGMVLLFVQYMCIPCVRTFIRMYVHVCISVYYWVVPCVCTYMHSYIHSCSACTVVHMVAFSGQLHSLFWQPTGRLQLSVNVYVFTFSALALFKAMKPP